ncbi:transient receptor potential cation channel subfamily M member 4-like isoform X2 [Cottoperca gobio]|uniref:Transient receptor potential cation channel subfamily M member 4-like isoform X2 n=1 Tax=Cottoperca gobio TaxID=56716 RepID=A0A6J2RQV8_COTGO|nr:transient receptor potential cation channel subfamily M member 4-like isoform X2 [Cottoperca gobio]
MISKHRRSWIPKIIKKRVCTTFVEDSTSNGARCQCGGTRDTHGSVALGDYFSTAIVNRWDSAQHSSEYPTDAFGELQFAGASKRHSYFLRLSWDTPPSMVYTLMTAHWGLPSPNLVVSIVGGEGRTKVKTWVREVLRQGLVKASQSTGAWILTAGLREGVGRCVGEAVRDHATAASSVSLNKVVALGIAPWGLVHNRDQLVNPQGSFPAKYYVQNTSRDSCCLDNNYQAFLLVDDGSVRRTQKTSFRAKLEDYISHQRTGIWGSGSIDIPVLCMLISGEASMLERVDLSLKNSIPWLVLAGSGGLADFLSDVVENLSSAPVVQSSGEGDGEASPSVDLKDRVAERVKKHFPSEAETDKLVERALSIYQNRDFITIYHGEQEGPNEFDTVLLKALVGASKHRASADASPYNEELRLAVTWNRVDIAKSELFNGDIHWTYEDLEDSMTDALVNDKPQFVRLFTENGLNILDYLTYGRLESLYRSVPDGTMLYQLLQRHLVERLGTAAYAPTSNLQDSASKVAAENIQSGSAKEISLFEVGRVLELLMGDVCQPFYYNALDIEDISSKRRALRRASKLLRGDCLYRDKRCLFPWASLFIWSVLQNRSEMATFFWEMAGEPVLSALSGCKILRELSKLEVETETKLSMKELAQRFENMAHDVFSSCYRSNESRSFTLLIRKSPVWGGTTCLQMGMGADARLFFSHDGVQSLMSQIWWGDMKRNTEVWKLLLTFFCPILCYTNIISFRKQEDPHQEDEGKTNEDGPGRDSDSLYGHTVFSFSDIKHIEADAHGSHTPRTATIRGIPQTRRPPKRPFIVSRWRQFWFAPVTSFLGNVLMYFLFLLLFAYVLLVDFLPPPPSGPAITEYVMYFWVFTIVCEEIRETFFLGTKTWRQRIRVYIQDVWNKCDLIAITLFIIGVICRMFPWSYGFGRDILCVDYMVFTLRLIHIFAIHKQLGPKIIIVGKMMKDIFFFLFFLMVWLMAYGVANQALLYSYDPSLERIFRRVFYRPYLHIFGQIPVEEMDVGKQWDMLCTHNVTLIQSGEEPCRTLYSNWLVVILLVVYLLVTNILLINLLIAMFSNTFSEVQGNSDIYWKFQRYNLIVQYHSRPSLAPPFIILSHINLFIKRSIRKVPSIKIFHFVLQLTGKAANRLMTWETIQKEDFLTAQNKIQKSSDSERLKRMSVKVDGVLKHMTESRDFDHRLRALENEMEYCSSALSWIVDTLAQGSTFKPHRPPPTVRDAFPSSSNSA